MFAAQLIKALKMNKCIIFFSLLIFASCGNQVQENRRKLIIDDLPFASAKDAKEYADLVIKAIRTNRDIPLVQEFLTDKDANSDRLNTIVGMYASAIGSREWEYFDIYDLSKKKIPEKGFDYVWKDLKGSTAMQIFILPETNKHGFYIKSLEFRSRIDVMESIAFPGGEIDNFKKIKY